MHSTSGITCLLSPDNLAFIQQGVSINAASRDVRRVPSLTRVLGCRVDEDGMRLRLVLSRLQSLDLLRDIRSAGVLAVVFTEPSTHRTLQIKGENAAEVNVSAADRDCLERSRIAFGNEIGQLGFDAEFNRRLFQVAADDVTVVAFMPLAVFQQSPGPNAGARLEMTS